MMFNGCHSLCELSIDNFDTSRQQFLNYMFMDCENLSASMTISSEPASYALIFRNCSSLSGSFTLNYTEGLEEVAQAMVASADGNPNVKVGELKQ